VKLRQSSKELQELQGFSWGVSEDVGKSIRILELFGLPGLKNLNQYFKDRDNKKFENLNLISQNYFQVQHFIVQSLLVSVFWIKLEVLIK
jgi:hypothetical protein